MLSAGQRNKKVFIYNVGWTNDEGNRSPGLVLYKACWGQLKQNGTPSETEKQKSETNTATYLVTILFDSGVNTSQVLQIEGKKYRITGVDFDPSSNAETFITCELQVDAQVPPVIDADELPTSKIAVFDQFGNLKPSSTSIQGTSGFSGSSGFSGFSGKSGFSGASGFSGTSGFSGKSGFSGAAATAPLTLTGSSNAVQLSVVGNAVQTQALQNWKSSAGIVQASITNTGAIQANSLTIPSTLSVTADGSNNPVLNALGGGQFIFSDSGGIISTLYRSGDTGGGALYDGSGLFTFDVDTAVQFDAGFTTSTAQINFDTDTYGKITFHKNAGSTGNFVINLRTDEANTIYDALYIAPDTAFASSRVFFGDSGHPVYAINFAHVTTFENFPSSISVNNFSLVVGWGSQLYLRHNPAHTTPSHIWPSDTGDDHNTYGWFSFKSNMNDVSAAKSIVSDTSTSRTHGTLLESKNNGTLKFSVDYSGALYMAPTSAPSSPAEGTMYYDSSAHALKVYNGTAWKTITWS